MGLSALSCCKNSVYPMQAENSMNTMFCESCTTKFTLLKKKWRCPECRRLFCSSCIVREAGSRRSWCFTCLILTAAPPDSHELMQVRVRDLRHFLAARHIATDTCTEKRDLVELVMQWHIPELAQLDVHPPPPAFNFDEPMRNISEDHHLTGERVASEESMDIDEHNTPIKCPKQTNEDAQSRTLPMADPVNDDRSNQRTGNEPIVTSANSDWDVLFDSGIAHASHQSGGDDQMQAEAADLSELTTNTNGGDADERVNISDSPKSEESEGGGGGGVHNEVKDIDNQPKWLDDKQKLSIADVLEVNPNDMSVRQLKEVLTRSFVMIRGICEKEELVAKLRILQQETKDNQRRVSAGLPEENLCKICMDAPVDCVLLDCGHLLTCTACGRLLSECPVCRQFVVRVVHTFRV